MSSIPVHPFRSILAGTVFRLLLEKALKTLASLALAPAFLASNIDSWDYIFD